MGEKEIRALFCVNTPAQAHTWQRAMKELIRKGHNVRILARDYGPTVDILTSAGLPVYTFSPITRKHLRILEIMAHLRHGLKASQGFTPTIVIGFGVDAAVTAGLLRIPCVVFMDSESLRLQAFITKLFASAIVTPECFRDNLGKKQIRVEGYKELAYLHPDYFKPDPSIYTELKIPSDEKYVILRFNVFDAVHDIGKHGFTTADQFNLVQELGKYARVFISPEGPIPEELAGYQLPISNGRIHHALYYAQLLVADTQTMTSEAAILGTPAVRCNSFVGPNDMTNFIELEQKYDLIYSFRDTGQAIQKAIELIQKPDLKEQWVKKRQRLLNDKIDVTRYILDFIESYPTASKNGEGKGNKL